MDRRTVLQATGLVGVAGLTTGAVAQLGDGNGHDTRLVPEDHDTVQAAVDAAGRGDLVLVGPGTYTEAVEVTTPEITIRGRDRNEVVLDGEFERHDGIYIEADGVAVENLTIRYFENNAVYWNEVVGFRGSYLTAHNNGYYGIYGYRSRNGRFEHCYASGHPDAGFYLGRNQPYEAVITDVVAEYNGMGYSGTSTGADLTIKDSIWRHNMSGILPNTLDTHDDPQCCTHIVGNVVYDNANQDAPTEQHTYPMFGSGILLWGGSDNLVEDNVVDGHPNYGIAAHPNVAEPSGNVVRNNTVSDSGRADLALGAPAGDGNEFENNQYASAAPEGIESDASTGAETVTNVYREQEDRAEAGEYEAGNWQDQPEPGPQPTMRDPTVPPRPAAKDSSLID